MRWMVGVVSLLALMTLGVIPAEWWQSVDCGTADVLAHPVDTSRFSLVQGYGVPSPRHQGRYHTGEDWAVPGGAAGEMVYAAGRGKVRYAYSLGWGRDGGAVIIEHRMADGVTFYTQYGHLTESDAVKFPVVGACVELGDPIGVMADVRPAPHVHFELRLAQPDTPGPGYTWEVPEAHPIQFRSPSEVMAGYAAR